MINPFDKFPDIKYTDLEYLFCNVYPYRVTLKFQYSNPNILPSDRFKEWMSFWGSVIDPKTNHFVKSCGSNIYYYIETEEEALAFIENNRKIISDVIRPEKESHLIHLQNNPHKIQLRIRNNYFWNNYPWRVTFAPNDCVYRWLDEYFDEDETINKGHNIAYFCNEADMIAAKLALSEHILKIEQIILKCLI